MSGALPSAHSRQAIRFLPGQRLSTVLDNDTVCVGPTVLKSICCRSLTDKGDGIITGGAGAHAIAADSAGNLYIGDVADESPAHRLQQFTRLPAEG
jgi:hypothetical protein